MRILNAAFDEFAEQGYEKASTNQIVKRAGIGKGMLFYYFRSKKELFKYLIDYGIKYVNDEFHSKIDGSETDFIEKYTQIARIKMSAYTKNPHVYNFFGSFYVNKELPEGLEEQQIKMKKLSNSKLYNNIDTSLFREDISVEQVIKLITWTLDGYEKNLVNSLKGQKLSTVDMDPYWAEFYDLLEVLKKIYYK